MAPNCPAREREKRFKSVRNSDRLGNGQEANSEADFVKIEILDQARDESAKGKVLSVQVLCRENSTNCEFISFSPGFT